MGNFYVFFFKNLAKCPQQHTFFGPPKAFQLKLWLFWHFYNQKWSKNDLAPVPQFDPLSLLDLRISYSCSYLSNKTLTLFLPFLVPDLQPNVPVTQLWCLLCITEKNPVQCSLNTTGTIFLRNTLCNVVQKAPDNITQEKIQCNIFCTTSGQFLAIFILDWLIFLIVPVVANAAATLFKFHQHCRKKILGQHWPKNTIV